jgi:hypothetical protein
MDDVVFDSTWFWIAVGVIALVAGILGSALMATYGRYDGKGPRVFKDVLDEMAGRKGKR